MARIFYSVSGEGRGHAARAVAMVDGFRHQHDVTLFASNEAYNFLACYYADRGSSVRVYPIKGLRFHYQRGRLALVRSIRKGVGFWAGVADTVDHLSQLIQRQRPDLVITDFEPLLPRASEQVCVPYISLDHQHFLTNFDLATLPVGLRTWASLMKLAVAAHYTRQASTVVTSFFQLPLKPGYEKTISVGPIVRQGIAKARPSTGDYLVSYLRKHTPERVFQVLESAPCEVRIYGVGKTRTDTKKLRFHSFSENAFAKDLAGCLGVVGAAGNQTLGEALYLGKPVLALPEAQHFEQRINAFYLQQLSYGRTTLLSEFQERDLAEFVGSIDEYSSRVRNVLRDGTSSAICAIESYLGEAERLVA